MNYIREARKAKKISMKELGERVGCTEAAISNYELFKRKPDFEVLLRIAEELDTTVDYLMRGNQQTPVPEDDEKADEPINLTELAKMNIIKLSDLEMEFVRLLRSMSEENRQALLSLLRRQ